MIHSVKCNADCIGCGNCERTCKGIFRLTYSVHAEAVGRNYEKHHKQLVNAYYGCPVQAIEMDSDDPSVQIAWYKAAIVEKRKLSESVMEIRLKSKQNDFVPGQYITVRFKDDIGFFNRAYSIVEFKDGMITLCVTLLNGGRGSSFFVNYDVGDEVEVTEPKGGFCLQDNDRPKVFVGTGTGLAPLIPMMESCPEVKKALFFGQRKEKELFYLDRLAKIPNLDVHICLDFADDDWTGFRGRVTDDFVNYPLTRDTEVYTCGSDPMMEGLRGILKKKRHPSKLFFKESFNSAAGSGLSDAGLLWHTWVRSTHIYASLAMSMLFLFFGLSGFLASRPSLFNSEIRFEVPENIQMEQAELSGYLKSKLPAGVNLTEFSQQDGWAELQFEDAEGGRFDVQMDMEGRNYDVAESHALPAGSESMTALQLAKMLAEKYPGKLDEGSVDEDGDQTWINLDSVWASTVLVVDRSSQRYEVQQHRNRAAAALVQLHRGKKSNPLQRVLIDLTGIFMVLVTLTGILLGVQSRNPLMRNTALALVGLSLVLTVVMILNR